MRKIIISHGSILINLQNHSYLIRAGLQITCDCISLVNPWSVVTHTCAPVQLLGCILGCLTVYTVCFLCISSCLLMTQMAPEAKMLKNMERLLRSSLYRVYIHMCVFMAVWQIDRHKASSISEIHLTLSQTELEILHWLSRSMKRSQTQTNRSCYTTLHCNGLRH